MITAVVNFKLPAPITRAEAETAFYASVPKYKIKRAGPVPVQFMVDAAHGGTDPNSACKPVAAPALKH